MHQINAPAIRVTNQILKMFSNADRNAAMVVRMVGALPQTNAFAMMVSLKTTLAVVSLYVLKGVLMGFVVLPKFVYVMLDTNIEIIRINMFAKLFVAKIALMAIARNRRPVRVLKVTRWILRISTIVCQSAANSAKMELVFYRKRVHVTMVMRRILKLLTNVNRNAINLV